MTRVASDEARVANREAQRRRRARLREEHAAGLIEIPAQKQCGGCRCVLPSKSFSRSVNTHDGLNFHCRACDAMQQRSRTARAQANDPDGYRARRAEIVRKHRYGVTAGEFDRMLEEQEFGCAICSTPGQLVVDHDHGTGIVRGLLCRECNSGIGMLGDDPIKVAAALSYLLPGG